MSGRRAVMALFVACISASAHAQQGRTSEPAELIIWHRPVVSFRATVAGAPPEQRVRNARARIDAHTAGLPTPTVATRAASIGDAEGIVVTVGEHAAFGIVDADLDAESSLTLEQTATQAAERLREVFAARERQQRASVIARGTGLALLALIVFAIATKLIVVAREVAVRKIDALLRERRLAIGGIDILPTLATVERATFRVLSWGAIGALCYVTLVFLLHSFPYTEPLGRRLGDYLRERIADGLTTFILSTPSIVAIVAVLLVTRAVALWASRLLAEVEHGARVINWLAQEQARATRRIASGLIWLLGLGTAYSLLPWSGSPIFRGMSLVLGLGVSLASAGLVSQWISGLVVLYSRSFRIGDYVMIGDVDGYVAEVGPLATKLKTMRREEITIPNTVLTTNKIINFTRLGRDQGALLSVSVGIGYAIAWRQVEALLLQAAAETQGVRPNPSPRVLPWTLGDFYVEYQLHVFLERAEERAIVRAELNSRILDRFTAAGVQIMTPHFESQPDAPVIASRASHPA